MIIDFMKHSLTNMIHKVLWKSKRLRLIMNFVIALGFTKLQKFKHMKNTTFFLFLFAISLLATKRGQAQDSEYSRAWSGGFGYFLGGYQVLNLDNLNSDFSSQGFPEVNTGSLRLGGGGFFLVNNWIIGGMGRSQH